MALIRLTGLAQFLLVLAIRVLIKRVFVHKIAHPAIVLVTIVILKISVDGHIVALILVGLISDRPLQASGLVRLNPIASWLLLHGVGAPAI